MIVTTSPIIQNFKPLRITIDCYSAAEMDAIKDILSKGRSYFGTPHSTICEELLPHFTRV